MGIILFSRRMADRYRRSRSWGGGLNCKAWIRIFGMKERERRRRRRLANEPARYRFQSAASTTLPVPSANPLPKTTPPLPLPPKTTPTPTPTQTLTQTTAPHDPLVIEPIVDTITRMAMVTVVVVMGRRGRVGRRVVVVGGRVRMRMRGWRLVVVVVGVGERWGLCW